MQLAHSHSLLFSITLRMYPIVIFCIYCSTHTFIMFSLGVFILIHNIGLFTNIALNGTLTLFADIALSRLRSIRLLSESIWIWLFGHDRIEQSVWFFCLGQVVVNRIVPCFDSSSSSHWRDIFLTTPCHRLPFLPWYSFLFGHGNQSRDSTTWQVYFF